MIEQLKRLAASLTRKQKVWIATSAILVAAALAALLHYHRERDFRPLFTGLSAEDAGQVVARLKEAGVDYRLADNGATILVRSARVADVRLLVASAGLPKTGRIGFEIFDKTNFGTSDFAEQVNYRRALEGELERSVMALSEVEQARVHLTMPKESIFAEMRQPAKASVLVKLKPAASLSPQNVAAIGHLVASAVEGLTPEQVTVVDMHGNLLSRHRRSGKESSLEAESAIEYRRQVERDLLAKIQATLEPVLGADHFRAGVSVDVDFSSGEQSEESYDPNRSVMVTQQRSEESSQGPAAAGIPGTPSNLPRPMSRPGNALGSGVLRRTENITYQSSRTVKRTTIPQGAIRRISVSAILDQELRWEGTGSKAKRILVPPSEEKLKTVRDLVAAAIGFQQERGDQIVVQSLPFESTLQAPPPPDPKPPASTPVGKLPFGLERFLSEKNKQINPMILIGAAAAVLLLAIVAVVLLLRRRKKKKVVVEMTGPPELAAAATKPEQLPGAAPTQASLEEQLEARLAAKEAERQKAEMEVLDSLRLPDVQTKKAEVLTRHIAEQAKRDPAAMAQLLRSWIRDREMGFGS